MCFPGSIHTISDAVKVLTAQMFSAEVVSTSVVMSMGTVLSQQRLSKSMSDEVIDVGGLCKKTLMSLIKDALVMAVQV